MTNTKVLKRIEDEIKKIDKKENNIYFFITSTHGIFDETIDYEYKMAYLLRKIGYNVAFIHQDEKFEQNEWVSNKEFLDIPTYDIAKGEVNVGVSDVLFIPEVFASVMNQTVKLPCKRIALIQNIQYLTKFMPLASQFGDFGIIDFLTFSEGEAQLIKSMFPYMKSHVAHTYIDEQFYCKNQFRDMVINIVSKSADDVNQIAKQFYWKYPLYKWVTFKDMRGLSQEDYKEQLQVSKITIWVDDNADNGIEILEAMASGNIVIAKIPEIIPDWFKNSENTLNNAAVWVSSIQEIPSIVANITRSVITEKIPSELYEDMKKVVSEHTKQRSMEEIEKVINDVLAQRRQELENIITQVKKEAE